MLKRGCLLAWLLLWVLVPFGGAGAQEDGDLWPVVFLCSEQPISMPPILSFPDPFPGAYYYSDYVADELHRVTQAGDIVVGFGNTMGSWDMGSWDKVSPDGRLAVSRHTADDVLVTDFFTREQVLVSIPPALDPREDIRGYYAEYSLIEWISDNTFEFYGSFYIVSTDPLSVQTEVAWDWHQSQPMIRRSLGTDDYRGIEISRTYNQLVVEESGTNRYSFFDQSQLISSVDAGKKWDHPHWSPNERYVGVESFAYASGESTGYPIFDGFVVYDIQDEQILFDMKDYEGYITDNVDVEYQLYPSTRRDLGYIWSRDSRRFGFGFNVLYSTEDRGWQDQVFLVVVDVEAAEVRIICAPEFGEYTDYVGSVRGLGVFSPDGEYYGYTTRYGVVVYQIATGERFILPGHSDSFPGWVEQPAPVADAGADSE